MTQPPSRRLVRNALRCLGCGDVIESKHIHDFVTCSCGAWSVDGGHAYVKRSFREEPWVGCEDLTRWEPCLDDNDGIKLPDERM